MAKKSKDELRKSLQAKHKRFGDNSIQHLLVSEDITNKLYKIIDPIEPDKILIYRAVEEWGEIIVSELSMYFAGRVDEVGVSKNTPFPEDEYDIVVVPLLGFSRDGFRLGRGGGWYDRFLITQPQALIIGVGYDDCSVDFEPEDHDIPMHIIVTEKRTLDFRSKIVS